MEHPVYSTNPQLLKKTDIYNIITLNLKLREWSYLIIKYVLFHGPKEIFNSSYSKLRL